MKPRHPALRLLPILLAGALNLPTPASAEPKPEDLRQAGKTAFTRGDFETAIENWTAAIAAYDAKGQTAESVKTMADLGAAYQYAGQPELSEGTLKRAAELAKKIGNDAVLATIENNLGSLYVQQRQPEAETHLKNAIALVEKTDTRLAALAWNNLGNFYVTQEDEKDATDAYNQAIVLAKKTYYFNFIPKVSLNRANQALRINRDYSYAASLRDAAESKLAQEDSYDKASFLLGVSDCYLTWALQMPATATYIRESSTRYLLAALKSAENLKDTRTASLASGMLGNVAELNGRTEDAFRYTRRARFLAQQVQAPYLLYRWEWQLARLFRSQKQDDEAIKAYRRAIASYGTLGDCASPASLGEVNFQDTVRPLYYGLADLLLQQAKKTDEKAAQPLLIEARDTVEKLKSAELVDYFQDTCVSAGLSKVKDVDSLLTGAAVIYYIPLPDRTEILVGLPGGLHSFSTPINAGALAAKVRRLRLHLQRSTSEQYLPYATELYDLLIRPVEPTLTAAGAKTLILVPDGALRTVPLAALHDGKQFLLEKYAVAVTPGLTLMDPRPLQTGTAAVLIAGLSQSVQGRQALGSVPQEVKSIESDFPVKTLLNKDFVESELQTEFTGGNFSVVHIASHGEFTGSADKSYLLTYDGKLTVNDLEKLIRPRQFRGAPVEMLFLSACQTAVGDDRAALGLAGIAIKSGARSALASLWSVSDDATAKLVAEFYNELKRNPNQSKAEALRQAQLALLHDPEFEAPMFWSPFQVIGNWY